MMIRGVTVARWGSDAMIHAVYRWTVKPGEEGRFRRAWAEGTRIIRAHVRGAGGSLLLQKRGDPTVFMAIAQWESFEDWQAFSASEPPAPQAFQQVAAVSNLVATELFEEMQDLIIE
jgi:heme-degrading monooxygenase HmoA